MDSLLYDVRAALRRLPKTPWFTLAVVATLAVVPADRHGDAGVSVPDFLDLRQQSRRVDGYASYPLGPGTLTGRGTPERLNEPSTVIAAAARSVSAEDPDVPIFHARTVSTDIADSLARPRLYAAVIALFAGVSLLLAIIGIYGVLAFIVRERRRELGIRIALGARANQVIGLVVGQGLRLTALGLIIGCGTALIGSRVLTGLLFGVRPNDLTTYEIVCLPLLVVAALACWIPARSAAAIDPMITMRSE